MNQNFLAAFFLVLVVMVAASAVSHAGGNERWRGDGCVVYGQAKGAGRDASNHAEPRAESLAGGTGLAETVDCYAEAVTRTPGSAEARFRFAEVLFKAERLNEALLNYTLAIAVEPNHAGALLGRSRLCTMLGLHGQALKDLNRLIVLRPGNAEFHYQRARILLKLESVKAAYRDFLRAHELDKRYPRPTLVGEEPPVRRKTAGRGGNVPRGMAGAWCADRKTPVTPVWPA